MRIFFTPLALYCCAWFCLLLFLCGVIKEKMKKGGKKLQQQQQDEEKKINQPILVEMFSFCLLAAFKYRFHVLFYTSMLLDAIKTVCYYSLLLLLSLLFLICLQCAHTNYRLLLLLFFCLNYSVIRRLYEYELCVCIR